jgi:hypothetical protein
MVRAKFTVSSITEYAGSYKGAKVVKLSCIYDKDIPEDQRFFDATPSGSVEMLINNPAALEQFTLGKQFYADFIPVYV